MSLATPRRALALVCALLCAQACQCSNKKPPKEPVRPEGAECEEDVQCETGLCESVRGDVPRCVRKCTTGCRALEVCSELSKERYGCVPMLAGLCNECEKDSDCPYAADRCIRGSGGYFCGRDCGFDGKCPSSFFCSDAGTLTDGEIAGNQCVPQSGSCSCTDATAGQTVPCENANALGRCVGVKRCEPPNGYAACSAPAPVAETCNNLDDDCDGRVDEDLGDVRCGVGECTRVASMCANGLLQTCMPGSPQTERCDDKDNDCDGTVDDGFDFMNDVGNCGGCGVACVVSNAVPKCSLGRCAIDHCLPGFSDRDGVAANGCEYPCTPTPDGGVEVCDGVDNDCDGQTDEGYDLASDPMNCGLCGFVCSTGNGTVATYQCVGRQCGVLTCAMGFADCNQLYADGCEVDVRITPQHCGACGAACSPPNATGVCAVGTCSIGSCAPGYANCNGAVADGCERPVSSDVMNCGACGNVCSAPGADATCVGGTCRYTCQPGQVSLDGGPGCTYTCAPTNGGVERCDLVDNDCDGQVDEGSDVSSDVNNCGACGNVCNIPFATPACVMGACRVQACLMGHSDLDGNPANGCEYTCLPTNGGVEQCDGLDNDCDGQIDEGFSLSTDVNHCGACNRVCSAPNVSASACTSGSCGVTSCVPGFANCNGTYPDGCEVNVLTNAQHCGACGVTCMLPFTNPVCAGGVCRATSCTGGHWNLDGVDANGCEYACTPTNGGVEICDGLDNDCDGAIDEGFNLSSDVNNCGVCGRVCAAANVSSSQCVVGSCQVLTCAAGFANCNGAYSDGCEVDTRSTLAHCGACGNACNTPNATPACVNSSCAVAACTGTFRNCNGQVPDGCEVNSATDPANCGSCGFACNLPHATSVCGASVCRVQVCQAGWFNLDGLDANGCEYSCAPSNGGVEICDGLDNDCDGQTDEGFSLSTNPSHCGSCNNACTAANVAAYQCTSGSCGVLACASGFGNCNGTFGDGCEVSLTNTVAHCGACGAPCAPPNATPQCSGGACGIAACNGSFRNCNGTVADGCEVNSANDVNNCGGCNVVCSFAHASSSCGGGTCSFTCQPNFYNLDGNPANGCEYACVFQSATDLPDLGFGDANCDGIDGDVTRAIFVDAVSGNDGWPGTRAQPKRSIAAGIAAAAPSGFGVYVSQGTYAESVNLVSGVSLYGGYAAATGWTRSSSNVSLIASPTSVGVTMNGVGTALELQLFTVRTANATGTDGNGGGNSTMGVLVLNSSPGLTVSGCTVQPGSGSAGVSQGASGDGPAGDPGGNAGGAGPGAPGPGGGSVCGAPGGAGGTPGRGGANGLQGGDGATAPGGAPGSTGGAGGLYPGSNTTGRQGLTPGNGWGGAAGFDGPGGGAFGSFTAGGVYVPSAGGAGGDGQVGGGGGGAGGGSGMKRNSGTFCSNVHDLWGGYGGGGGGGGCGGTRGFGGRGGGGSFGLVSLSSGLSVQSSVVAPASGGNGGGGGAGGRGGAGGQPGGSGAGPQCESGGCPSGCGGYGGYGAWGGAGGNAGGGGGGGGGPSVCIVYRGAAPATSGFSCTPGAAGGGGLGGQGDVAPAPAGSAGTATSLVVSP